MLWQLNYSVLNKLILLLILAAIPALRCAAQDQCPKLHSFLLAHLQTRSEGGIPFVWDVTLGSTSSHNYEAVNVLMFCLLHLHHCWGSQGCPPLQRLRALATSPYPSSGQGCSTQLMLPSDPSQEDTFLRPWTLTQGCLYIPVTLE